MDPKAQPFRPRAFFPPTQVPSFPPQQMQMYQPMMPNNNETMSYQYPWLPQPLTPSTLPLPSPTPTRTLLLSMVPNFVSETTVHTQLQVFGAVELVQMERLQEGIVIVQFYDLRHSEAALAAIQNLYIQHQQSLKLYYTAYGSEFFPLPPLVHRFVAGSPIWAQFYVPRISTGRNQGILSVRHLNPEISSSGVLEIFEFFGAVKELKQASLEKHRWFVEFFDIRDAADAFLRLNDKKIGRKHLKIRFFTSPDGHGRM